MNRTHRLCLLAGLCTGMPAAAQSFTNGDFQTGTTSPWLVVNTPNGIGGPGTVPFIDIDGPGPLAASNVARFSVGQSVSVPGTFEGVHMLQNLSLVAGVNYQVDCDWAVLKSALPNVPDGGRFAVVVGGVTVEEDVAGTAGPAVPRYGHLTGQFTRSTSGSVSVGIRITRGFTPTTGLSQYVDNVTISIAPPLATSLGAIPLGSTIESGLLAAGEVRWYTFTIPAVASPAYLDIDTEGSVLAPGNDTELGLYTATGVLITTDDNDGSNLLSQLSYGNASPRPRVGNGVLYDGRDGGLAAGTYFLAVAGSNSTFGATDWSVASTSANIGNFQVKLVLGDDVAIGACCTPTGTCSIMTQVACTTANGGVYRGDGSDCGAANCPQPTPLGSLPIGTTTATGNLGTGQVLWYTFTVPAIATPEYLDIDTEGSALALSNDTELGLYTSAGALVNFDDDDGSNFLSQLTYGNTTARPPVGNGLVYNGRDGSLAAGTYYLSVSGFPSSFGASNWNVASISPYTGSFQVRLARGNDVATGACCVPEGTCSISTQLACAPANGVYQGDGSACGNCPPAGACCRADGSCATLFASQCTLAGGVFAAGTTCAGHVCPGGFGFSKTIAGTFTDIGTTGQVITITSGSNDDGTGPFTSSVTNALVTSPNLIACTNGFISNLAGFTSFTNQPLPVANTGFTFGLFPNWDDLLLDAPATLRHEARVENGVNVEIIQWNQARTFLAQPSTPRGTFQVKIFGPGGPALVQYLYRPMAWDFNGNSSTVGVQWSAAGAAMRSFGNTNAAPTPPGPIPDDSVLSIVGPSAACYANCDGSTTPPVLNVLDFACFLNRFAAGESYANCDASTTAPVLNVLDFACFLNQFAAGCGN